MLHLNILAPAQKKLFDIFSTSSFLSDFYLAGGTSLALQIGHRMSDDFDFFSQKDLNAELIKSELLKLGDYKISYEEKNTLHCVLDNVKLSFLTFRYKLLSKLQNENQINLCSLRDIACMKLSAIQSRGTKRDFIDFYFLLKSIDMDIILTDYASKFGENNFNLPLIKKSLIFFDDADEQLIPNMIIKADWTDIKKFFCELEKTI